MTGETITFHEVQRLSRWWVWTAVVAMNVLFVYALVQQVLLGRPFGNKPAPDWVLILIEACLLLLLLFLFSIRLKTSVDEKGISYRFYPFQFRTTFIAWHELRDAYIREYNSFHEYGGWGIRIGNARTGNAVNTSASGKLGLQLQFKDGKLLLVGTRRPAELKTVIDAVISSGMINREV
jgi:hypothetical protein